MTKRPDLLARYQSVRGRSSSLCAPLSAEDAQIQSMADASPAKWHLAHTTWFFETFVLATLGDRAFQPAFAYLFNSYYDALGARVARASRGLLSRPSLGEVHAYRAEIDARMAHVLVENRLDEATLAVVELGCAHEEQHQELILTDIKHALGTQPLRPAYRDDYPLAPHGTVGPVAWLARDGGVVEIGARDDEPAFDSERPRHRVLLAPYRIASLPVCNAEVIAFIAERGYAEPRLWLSDGWATVQREGWLAPLYWEQRDGRWWHYTLAGMREVDPAGPAAHLSYYEADAIARWAGARLPTEAEWEHASADLAHGEVWEWTQSAFAPYPGFRPLAGALGEYNGKFMANQLVLRGGSVLTPPGHARPSYRNFFPAAARWQMTGVRLARDGGAP